MKKIDITTEQWIEIHKELREKMPLWYIAELKSIFTIHKNERIMQEMQEIKSILKNVSGE